MWETYLWVAVGSGLGGAARLLCSEVAARLVGMEFPWGTLTVNVAGSLLIGVVAGLVTSGRFEVGTNVQQFLMVGVLGGYTTFSAFSLQTLALVRDGHVGRAGLYVGASILLCLVAVAIGYVLGGVPGSPQRS